MKHFLPKNHDALNANETVSNPFCSLAHDLCLMSPVWKSEKSTFRTDRNLRDLIEKFASGQRSNNVSNSSEPRHIYSERAKQASTSVVVTIERESWANIKRLLFIHSLSNITGTTP